MVVLSVSFPGSQRGGTDTAESDRPFGQRKADRCLASRKDRAAGADGKAAAEPQPTGMLIYTKDGHMSVQLMYPGTSLSNEYVNRGYEASFGSYDLDEFRHLLTHHVQGSVTRDRLVGRDLPRRYEFTPDGHLLIRSAPEEHSRVMWKSFQ